MAKQSTFQRLCKIVEDSGVLEAYKNDLYVHDKYQLARYPEDSPFIYAWRKSGTSMVMMLPSFEDYAWGKNCPVEKGYIVLKEDFLYIDGPLGNTEFMHFDGKNFVRKTKEQAKKIYMTHVDIIISKHKAKQHQYVY